MTGHTLTYISWILIVCVTIYFNSAGAQPQENHLPPRNVSLQQTATGTLQIRQTFPPRLTYKTTAEASSGSTPATDLTIDLRTIDTAPYADMYRLWTEVPVAFAPYELAILDANNNRRKEINGEFKDYATLGPGKTRIYEFDGDSSFSLGYEYPDTLAGAYAVGDFDGDGLVDAVYYSTNIYHLETQSNKDSLPTIEKFNYNFGGEPYNVKAYDVNGDGRPELIYRMLGDHPGPFSCPTDGNYIEGYDSATNCFRVLYCNKPQQQHTEGFALGDFDRDGKQNMATGGINGMLFVYEHQGSDSFTVQSLGYVGVNNAYLLGFTNDMDGDGKPELWVGGDTYVSGVGVTRLFIYEATGDNSYQVVYTIDLIGVFSFFAGNMVAADFDHDGKEELLLCIDQHVLIFKSNGLKSYYLWYIRTNELNDAGLNSVVYSSTVADFDNDGYPEILVTLDQINNYDQIRYFTRLYKYNKTTGVGPGDGQLPSRYELDQNYPNPFNGETIVRYKLPNQSAASISVYDVLGREVRELVKGMQPAGAYEVHWDGRDHEGRQLPSGVYLIRLRANEFTRTIKAMMLK